MKETVWREKFAEKLAEKMNEKGYSQSALANKAKLTQPAISNYLLGQSTPNVRAVINLSHALKCTIGELVDFGERIQPIIY